MLRQRLSLLLEMFLLHKLLQLLFQPCQLHRLIGHMTVLYQLDLLAEQLQLRRRRARNERQARQARDDLRCAGWNAHCREGR